MDQVHARLAEPKNQSSLRQPWLAREPGGIVRVEQRRLAQAETPPHPEPAVELSRND